MADIEAKRAALQEAKTEIDGRQRGAVIEQIRGAIERLSKSGSRADAVEVATALKNLRLSPGIIDEAALHQALAAAEDQRVIELAGEIAKLADDHELSVSEKLDLLAPSLVKPETKPLERLVVLLANAQNATELLGAAFTEWGLVKSWELMNPDQPEDKGFWELWSYCWDREDLKQMLVAQLADIEVSGDLGGLAHRPIVLLRESNYEQIADAIVAEIHRRREAEDRD